MDTKEIEDRINKSFVNFKSIIKKKFKPRRFILFGSRARKEGFIYSDFDFLIVSDRFRGLSWHERISQIVKYWDCEVNIDVLPYTPEEFKKKKETCIVQQVINEGFEP